MGAASRLTGLAPDPRQPGYRLVEVDRGRFASLPAELLDPLGLQVGDILGGSVQARLRELAELSAAERAALRALERRGYAGLDLRRRLIGRQHCPQAVDAALARLAARGLMDDAGFATHYAALGAARGKGPARLVSELLRQGVDRTVAEAAVRRALADEGIDPTAAARTMARKRAGQLRHLPRLVRKRRLLAFLARRGYAAVELRELVDELCR
jgi:regulatory protein